MTAEPGGRRRRTREPLLGRVVLVVGGGDPAAQAIALRLSAHGASLVVAGPALTPVLATAGLAAASGGTARVIEAPSPPLLGRALLEAARHVLAPPTDALVSAAAFSDPADARAAHGALEALLGPGGITLLVEARPPGGVKAAAVAMAERFLARFDRPDSTDSSAGRDG